MKGELVVMCRHIEPMKIETQAYGFWRAQGVTITCSCHGKIRPQWLALCKECADDRKGKRPLDPGQQFDGKHVEWTGPAIDLVSVQ